MPLPAHPAIDPQLWRDLELVDGIESGVGALVMRADLEAGAAGEAVERRGAAAVQGQVEQPGIRLGREQHLIAERPVIVGGVIGVIEAAGELVAARRPLDRRIGHERADLLAHFPDAGAHHPRIGAARHCAAAVDIGQAGYGRARATQRGGQCCRRSGRAFRHQPDRVGIAAEIGRALAQPQAVGDFIVEADAGVEHVGAASFGKVDGPADHVGGDLRLAAGEHDLGVARDVLADVLAALVHGRVVDRVRDPLVGDEHPQLQLAVVQKAFGRRTPSRARASA